MTLVLNHYTKRGQGKNKPKRGKGMESLYRMEMQELMAKIRSHQDFDKKKGCAPYLNGVAFVSETEPKVSLRSMDFGDLALLAVKDLGIPIDPREVEETVKSLYHTQT